jgi:hypothetical protein
LDSSALTWDQAQELVDAAADGNNTNLSPKSQAEKIRDHIRAGAVGHVNAGVHFSAQHDPSTKGALPHFNIKYTVQNSGKTEYYHWHCHVTISPGGSDSATNPGLPWLQNGTKVILRISLLERQVKRKAI